ncbi:MAG: O-antigen ligase family protein [Chloroflexi bacterium]|nr:O-antigen ligase family protein [Chloroflexota bacterium]
MQARLVVQTYPSLRDAAALAVALAAGLALALLPLSTALVLVAGTGVLLAALVRPEVALWLLIFAVPFGGLRQWSLGGFNVTATEPLVAVLGVAWLAGMVRQRAIRFTFTPLLIALLLFLGALLLSLFDALSLSLSAKELLKWGEFLVVYVVVVHTVNGYTDYKERRQVAILLALVLLAGALEAAWGLYGSLQRLGPPSYAIVGGRLFRAFGTFGQPNPFGGYINLSLPLGLSLLIGQFADWRSRAPLHPRTLAILSACALLGLALILSWSRGAWLGAAVAVGVVVLAWGVALLWGARHNEQLRRAGERLLLVLLIVAIMGGTLVLAGAADLLPASVTSRLGSIGEQFGVFAVRTVKLTDENYAAVERMAHWQAALSMIQARPLLGYGIGNYPAAYPQYNLPGWEDPLGHAHNYYLNVAAETGLVGLAAYLLWLLLACAGAWMVAVRATSGLGRAVAIGVLGVLAAQTTHNVFDNLWVHSMAVQVALLLGLVYAVGQEPDGG